MKRHLVTTPARPMIRHAAAALLIVASCSAAQAQQPPAAPAAPLATPAPAPPQQFQPSGEWQKLPRMELERQFAGPLQDTVVQRWRDPVDGSICYIYLPISAPHSAPTANGFVQYGAATIGSISCTPGTAPVAAAQKRR